MTDEKSVVTPGWCTNWEAFNTPRIWAMVADEDNAESWKQVAALGAMADKLKDQRSRLLTAREALVSTWPPDTNPGAEAFVSRIDTLLANMADTKGKADENAAHLGHVIETLRQAKTKVEPLYQQYLDKSDDLIPNWWDNAEDDIDAQARQYMIEAERDVATHAEKIAAPAPYKLAMSETRDKSESEFPQSDTTPRHSPAGSSLGGNVPVGVPHDPPPPLPGHEPALPPAALSPSLDGPGLTGFSPTAPGGSGAGPQAPPPGSAPPNVPLQPGTIIGGGGVLSPGNGGGRRGTIVTPFGGSPVGRGGYSGTKPATPSWLPTGTAQPGFLGQTGLPVRGTSGGTATRGRPANSYGPAVGRRAHKSGESNPEFDPDNPWATAEGVSPVIEPSRDVPRHDPGPGVIGQYE